GLGMAPEVIDRAFEPFFTTKDAGKGSGLGLSQVYGSITQAGGCILIDSLPEQGTAFSVYLPRAEVFRSQSTTINGLAQDAASGSETIRIVDDNEDVREVTALIVGSLGYEVLRAGDGGQALALIDQRRDIDLMVSDIVMSGGIDGVELARRAR